MVHFMRRILYITLEIIQLSSLSLIEFIYFSDGAVYQQKVAFML